MTEREEFEEKVYARYFLNRIERTENPIANAVQIHFVPKALPRAVILRRDANNNYADANISAMWFGWQLAKGIL